MVERFYDTDSWREAVRALVPPEETGRIQADLIDMADAGQAIAKLIEDIEPMLTRDVEGTFIELQTHVDHLLSHWRSLAELMDVPLFDTD